MDRRRAIQNIALGAAGLVVSPALFAEQKCVPLTPYVNRCTAGIAFEKLQEQFVYQQQTEWCWAACISMIFGYWGHPVSQMRIVKETWGVLTNMPGSPQQVLADLNRSWVDDHGRAFKSQTHMTNNTIAITDLQSNRPSIIGALGHAMVLTAVTWDGNPSTQQWQIDEVLVRDPWPGNGSRRVLTLAEWMSIAFAAGVEVS